MLTDGLVAAAPDGVQALVVGASAGAIDALRRLLPALEAPAAVAVIVVVHIPARGPSALVELFAPRCAVPVREARDKEPVSPGIWFAPPDYHLLVEFDRTFSLSVDEPVNFSRPSIDVLFESASETYGAALAAVVLTGASADGARGARAVREGGGFVAVQEPASADAPAMPAAAIELANPQLVGTLPVLASFLRAVARSAARERTTS